MDREPAARRARLRPGRGSLRVGATGLWARRRRLFRGIPVALLLAGCTPTTQLERAQFLGAPAMERTLARSGLAVSDDTGWPREEWWRAFRSAELDSIINKALRDNQSLRKATLLLSLLK